MKNAQAKHLKPASEYPAELSYMLRTNPGSKAYKNIFKKMRFSKGKTHFRLVNVQSNIDDGVEIYKNSNFDS
jgi:hypothetical protein